LCLKTLLRNVAEMPESIAANAQETPSPVDALETVSIKKRLFFTIAKDTREYEVDVTPLDDLLGELRKGGVDMFTFIERGWCFEIFDPPGRWARTSDNVALLCINSYPEWLRAIIKKTRHDPVKRAEKKGIKVTVVKPDEQFAEGIWRIYNETPVRQGRAFSHYGVSLDRVMKGVLNQGKEVYVGAYFQTELAGFIQLIFGDNIAIISQILSLTKHFDKNVNKALVAKAVEVCAGRREHWLMYARMGNHPSLDKFKEENGFVKFELSRYYVPLSMKGRIAISLGLHRDIKDALPVAIKYPMIPIFNWLSRNKQKVKLALRRTHMQEEQEAPFG
jgi:hypothetical protein